MSQLALTSQASTPAKGYEANYGETDSHCIGTEVGMSSSKK